MAISNPCSDSACDLAPLSHLRQPGTRTDQRFVECPSFSIPSWQFLLLCGPVHSFWCQVLLQSIVSEVDAAWWALMHQLIAALRTDLQLPRCLQVVGYLRRMQIFSEAELRLKFLQVRDSWLQSELAKIPTDDGTNVAYSLKLVIYFYKYLSISFWTFLILDLEIG